MQKKTFIFSLMFVSAQLLASSNTHAMDEATAIDTSHQQICKEVVPPTTGGVHFEERNRGRGKTKPTRGGYGRGMGTYTPLPEKDDAFGAMHEGAQITEELK